MKPMRIAICDDIREDAVLLRQYLTELLPESKMDLYDNGGDLIEEFYKLEDLYDMLFITIHMPEMDGIEIVRSIRKKDLSIPVVFVSDSGEYYREAFDLFAFNYLLKTVDKEKLEHILRPLLHRGNAGEERVVNFRYRSQVHTLRLSQISYISSSLHTVNFHLKDGTVTRCRGKLNDFTDQLRDSSFLRCHQSFFVNMSEITAMRVDRFLLGEKVIPISRSYAKQVQEKYRDFLMKKSDIMS